MATEQTIRRALADLPKVPKVSELDKAIRDCGFQLMPDRGKGSHRAYGHPEYPRIGTIVISGRSGSDASFWITKHVKLKLREFQRMVKP